MAFSDTQPRQDPQRGVIELRLKNVNQLFNSLDPTPFPEKDLDADAEEFIVSWAHELPHTSSLVLHVYLTQVPEHSDPVKLIREGVHSYFAHREVIARRQLHQLLARGRWSLFIGLLFLALCLGASDQLGALSDRPIVQVISESFVIAGWVAMWRPMEIFLYDWWPVRSDRQVYQRLAQSDVRVTLHSETA